MKKGIYLFLTVLIVACSSDDNNNVDDTQAEWLYVHTAIEANATNSKTLVMPVTNDIFAFTDRPDREHKYISAEEFVSYWSEDATNSFQFDPPNAVLTSVNGDATAELEVVIIDASTDGDNITYTIQNPKLTENATFEDVSLFVDGGDTGNDNLAIGQWYQGGVIFYIFQSGDTGYVAGETHGLIAATVDQSSGIQWWNGSYIVTSATGSAIGTGFTNTYAIIAAQGSGSYAAQLCADYSVTVNDITYDDWFLPSQNELYLLYYNRVAIGEFDRGFFYWSSTEYDYDTAFNQGFEFGNSNLDYKASIYSVRAVRAF
jgi:hypothetical protein